MEFAGDAPACPGGCFDCHSSLTEWPWYTNVAPVSWLTQRDVNDGRAVLNSPSGSGRRRPISRRSSTIRGKDMPPLKYRLIHSDARLSDNERQRLEAGLVASWSKGPAGPQVAVSRRARRRSGRTASRTRSAVRRVFVPAS